MSRRMSGRSEEHTSELQSLRTISYAVFCLKKQISRAQPLWDRLQSPVATNSFKSGLDRVCSFFVNDTPTTEIYTVRNTLALHDALPISNVAPPASAKTLVIAAVSVVLPWSIRSEEHTSELQSLRTISYAVFCLKKK